MGADEARRHDSFRLLGQDNLRLYRPRESLRIRLHPDDSTFETFARSLAAHTTGCRATISCPPDSAERDHALIADLRRSFGDTLDFVLEEDAQLVAAIRGGEVDYVRYADDARVARSVRRAAAEVGAYLAVSPVLAAGRIELLPYLQEQSLSIDYHRYGNLAGREGERRGRVT